MSSSTLCWTSVDRGVWVEEIARLCGVDQRIAAQAVRNARCGLCNPHDRYGCQINDKPALLCLWPDGYVSFVLKSRLPLIERHSLRIIGASTELAREHKGAIHRYFRRLVNPS